MNPPNRHRLAMLIAIILSINNSTSFPTSSISSRSAFIAHAPSRSIQTQRRPSPLMAVDLPTRPSEYEEHEKDREKTAVGRFVPKFFKRRSHAAEQDSRILTIDTLSQYKEHVVNQDGLVVVRFYAPWCKSCKASFPLFKQLMSKYPEVKYVQVPLTKETAYIHEGLGVTSVPFAHVYHPDGGLVEEKKINKRVFGEFAEVLGWYVQGECELEEEVEIEEEGFQ